LCMRATGHKWSSVFSCYFKSRTFVILREPELLEDEVRVVLGC
jgi:hypothetical protein